MTEEDKLKNEFLFHLKNIKERECLELVKNSSFELDYHSEWNMGITALATLIIKIDRVIYERLIHSIKKLKKLAEKRFLELIFNNIMLKEISIEAVYEVFVDWDAIRGVETKDSIIDKVKQERGIFLSCIPLKSDIDENEFKKLNKHLRNCFAKLGITYPHDVEDYSKMYNLLREVAYDTGSYKLREEFIYELYKKTLDILEKSYDDEGEVGSSYVPTGWALIDKQVNLMLARYRSASNPIEYKAIGNMLRDILLEVSKLVYVDEIHHPSNFSEKIGPADYPRMLYGFFEHEFSGETNKEYRNLSRKTTDLANKITHSCDEKQELAIGVETTLFLIKLIKLTKEK